MALITRLAFFSFIVVCARELRAQEPGAGATAAALAHSDASVAATPFESANPAGLGRADRTSAAFSVEQCYDMTELRYASAGVVAHLGGAGIGVAAESFGFSDYRRATGSLGVAIPVASGTHMGVRATYRHVGAAGYPGESALGFSIGWLVLARESATIGGAWRYVGSPIEASKALLGQEVLIGAALVPFEGWRVFGSIAKEPATSPDLRLASEMMLSRRLMLRAGTGTNPSRLTFGIGMILGSLGADIGVGVHPVLGRSLATTVSLR